MTTTEPRPVITAQDLGFDVRPIAGHIGAEIHGVDLRSRSTRRRSRRSGRRCCEWKVSSSATSTSPRPSTSRSARYSATSTPAHPTLPADVRRLPRDPAARQPALCANGRGPTHREPLAHRRHVRAQPADGRRSSAASSSRRTAATRSGPTSRSPTSVSPSRSSDSSTACTPCTTTRCRSRGARWRPSCAASSSRATSASVHPVVRVHPETGERVLFVNPNFTSHIVELSRQEGAHLLAMLYEHMANAAFTVPVPLAARQHRVLGQPGDRAPRAHRRARRASTGRCSASRIAGDVPVGPDGSTSYALTGDTFG